MIAAIRRWLDGDVGHSFRSSPTAMVAALIAFVCVFCAVFAPWVAPHNPFDLATINLLDVTGHYTPERVAAIEAHLPLPARLCTALSLRLDPLDGAAA